jgi:hypothetical protein
VINLVDLIISFLRSCRTFWSEFLIKNYDCLNMRCLDFKFFFRSHVHFFFIFLYIYWTILIWVLEINERRTWSGSGECYILKDSFDWEYWTEQRIGDEYDKKSESMGALFSNSYWLEWLILYILCGKNS